MSDFIGCTIKHPPAHKLLEAAEVAVKQNPENKPSVGRMVALFETLLVQVDNGPTAEHLAVMTKRFWGSKGVKLTVAFLDSAPADVQARIISHMNAWSKYANVSFVPSRTDPQVRIARAEDGYWSYLGTDILGIPAGEPTMNLQGFTMNTPESEYHRVVRHETGHTLGFPHEHMRAELIARIDAEKAISYFGQTQGWSRSMVIAQVLTPLSAGSIQGTAHADQDSIMCYDLPGSITVDGNPIRGGVDIDTQDQLFVGKLYPLTIDPPTPPNPPNPPSGKWSITRQWTVTLTGDGDKPTGISALLSNK